MRSKSRKIGKYSVARSQKSEARSQNKNGIISHDGRITGFYFMVKEEKAPPL